VRDIDAVAVFVNGHLLCESYESLQPEVRVCAKWATRSP
jgi:hypothetical protein